MKTLIILILAAAGLTSLTFGQQPNATPTPESESRKLAVWYGQWSYAGENFPSPLGPAGKVTGTMTGRPIQNGFAGEFIYDETNPSGSVRNLEIDFWDPATNSFAYVFVGTDGYTERGPFWMKGLITTSEISVVVDGKTYQERAVETIAADGQSYIKKMEFSADGKKWLPLSETKYVKLPAAATGPAADEKELIKLEEQWAKAYLDRDTKAIDRFEADDWSCTDAEGKVTSKAQEHADVGSGTYQATEFKMSDLKVRTHGDTAVVTGRQTEVATMAGKDASAVFQITDTWFRRDGLWQCLATHVSKIAPPLDEAAIKHEIAQTAQGLFGAFSHADIDGILSFYADDPEFRAIEPDGKVTDSAAFRKSTREFFAGVASESIQTRSQDIRIIDPDTAILTWNGGFQTRMKDGTTVGCDSYGATFVFRRIGKDWKIIHDHESGVPPQPVKPVAASSVKPNTTVE